MKKNTNRFAQKAIEMKKAGRTLESIMGWWNRMVSTAEVIDGKAIFSFPESVPTGRGCYHFTGRDLVVLEMEVW